MSDPAQRRADGTLLPGAKLNPRGRPKGAKGVAKAIMDATNDGVDFVDWCLLLWKDTNAPIEWRWQAFTWLANRSLGSTPTTAILNITNINSGRDLRALSDDDIAEIDAVFEKANNRQPLQLPEGE